MRYGYSRDSHWDIRNDVNFSKIAWMFARSFKIPGIGIFDELRFNTLAAVKISSRNVVSG